MRKVIVRPDEFSDENWNKFEARFHGFFSCSYGVMAVVEKADGTVKMVVCDQIQFVEEEEGEVVVSEEGEVTYGIKLT